MKKPIYIYGQNGEERQLTAQEAVTNYLLGRSEVSLYEIRRRYGYLRVQMLLAKSFNVVIAWEPFPSLRNNQTVLCLQ